MVRRLVALLTVALLTLGLTAGAAFAAQPNVSCLRTGVSVLKANPDIRLSLAQSGDLGAVISDHLAEDAADRWTWC